MIGILNNVAMFDVIAVVNQMIKGETNSRWANQNAYRKKMGFDLNKISLKTWLKVENIIKVVESVMWIPESSAVVKPALTLMKNIWIPDCSSFYENIKNNKKFLM